MNRRGFTLLETLLYIALFSIVMSGAFIATLHMAQGSERQKKTLAVQEEGAFVMRKLNAELTNATSVLAPDVHTLHIEPGNVTVVYHGGALTLQRGDGEPQPLTNSRNAVERAEFSTSAGISGMPSSVHVRFVLAGKPFSFDSYIRR